MMISQIILNYVCDKLFVYQALATLTTFTTIRLVLFIRVRQKRFQLFRYYGIPGPKPCLLDGNLHEYQGQSIKRNYLIEAQFSKQYGKVYGIFIGDEPHLVITDLDILKQIFFEKMSSFKERGHVFLESPITKSILFAPHNRWKWMRKIMSPPFNTYRMRGESSTQFVEDSIQLMIGYIETKFDQQLSSVKEDDHAIELDLHSIMKATALKLISSIAIDLPNLQVVENESHVESLDSYLAQSDGGVVIAIIKFPFLKPLMEFLANHFEHGKCLALIRRGLNKSIDDGLKRLAQQNLSDQSAEQTRLLDTMIKLHHEGKLTRDEVIGNAEAILFAGYDTTSTTLTYIFWVLGKYPEIQDKLRNELMAHGTESKYLDQVINETMRIYPTVMNFVTRLATENVTINNWTIPSGTQVVYNSWLISRDPELWPEPEKFNPERFREGVEIHPCAFAPFGMGERKCLGYSLAKLELKMITCDILLRYQLKTKAPANLEVISYANVLTKPQNKVIIEMRRLDGGRTR